MAVEVLHFLMAFGMAAFTGIFEIRGLPIRLIPSFSVLLRALRFHPIGLSTCLAVAGYRNFS